MYKIKKKYLQTLLFMGGLVFLGASLFLYQSSPNIENSDGQQRTVILLDVSQSMNIQDMPDEQSRLWYAKKMIERYILENPDQVGVSIFAGRGINKAPISIQRQEILEIISGLDYRHIREQGSRIDLGILESLELFSDEADGNLIIFTDQDSLEHNIYQDRLRQLREITQELGLKIYLVGVGSTEGGYIPDGRDVMGNIQYKRYNGQLVKAPLEIEYLKDISSEIGAEYIDAEYFETMLVEISQGNILTGRNTASNLFLFFSFIFFIGNIVITYSNIGRNTIIS